LGDFIPTLGLKRDIYMRFLLIVLIWIFFVGGLWVYTVQRDASLLRKTARVAAPTILTGSYVLEITPSFTIEEDPFALAQDHGASSSPGFEVRLNGQALGVDKRPVERGKVIRITKNLTLSQGANEFYVKASPPMAETGLEHGLRVRLLDRGIPVVDRTIWGGAGAVVAGTVSVSLAAPGEDSHD